VPTELCMSSHSSPPNEPSECMSRRTSSEPEPCPQEDEVEVPVEQCPSDLVASVEPTAMVHNTIALGLVDGLIDSSVNKIGGVHVSDGRQSAMSELVSVGHPSSCGYYAESPAAALRKIEGDWAEFEDEAPDLQETKPVDVGRDRKQKSPALSNTNAELLSCYRPNPEAKVCYPGLEDLLNNPAFQCREEWRRKLEPPKIEPDEPLTFQPGANRRSHAPMRNSVVRAPAYAPRAGHRPRRVMPNAQPHTSLVPASSRPLVGPRTIRPVRECSGAVANFSRSTSPAPHEFASHRARKFSNCYQPTPQPAASSRKKRNVADAGSRLPPLPGEEVFRTSALQAWCSSQA